MVGTPVEEGAPSGTPWPMTPSWTCCISVSVTARPGTGKSAHPGWRQPVPVLDCGGAPRHRRVRLALPDHAWESWDYTATQHLILADIELQGKTRKVLMQAPKNGFFYLIDRTDGTLLSANNYIDITWATTWTWQPADRLRSMAHAIPRGPFTVYPSYLGGHNWHPMSTTPIPAWCISRCWIFPPPMASRKRLSTVPASATLALTVLLAACPTRRPSGMPCAPHEGRLLAWDPVTQREAWRVGTTAPGTVAR